MAEEQSSVWGALSSPTAAASVTPKKEIIIPLFSDEEITRRIDEFSSMKGNLCAVFYGLDGSAKTGAAIDSRTKEEVAEGWKIYVIDHDQNAYPNKIDYWDNDPNIICLDPIVIGEDGHEDPIATYGLVLSYSRYIWRMCKVQKVKTVIYDGIDALLKVCERVMKIVDLQQDPSARLKDNWDWCLDGDTLILMSDLTWKPIQHIEVGDQVIGLKENVTSKRMYYTPSKVTDKGFLHRPVTLYETANGSIKCTKEHKFLKAGSRTWIQVGNAKSAKLRFISKPEKELEFSSSYKKGYLSGCLQGDGHLESEKKLNFYSKSPEILNRLKSYLDDLDIVYNEYPQASIRQITVLGQFAQVLYELISNDDSDEWVRGYTSGFSDSEGYCEGSNVLIWNITIDNFEPLFKALEKWNIEYKMIKHQTHGFSPGKDTYALNVIGMNNCIRFYSIFRPARLTLKYKDKSLWSMNSQIESRLDLPPQKVWAITTETGNYIANGFISKNSYRNDRFTEIITTFKRMNAGKVFVTHCKEVKQWVETIPGSKKKELAVVAHIPNWESKFPDKMLQRVYFEKKTEGNLVKIIGHIRKCNTNIVLEGTDVLVAEVDTKTKQYKWNSMWELYNNIHAKSNSGVTKK